MMQLRKSGVISVLSSTVKLLTLSFFVGFGLTSCTHGSGDDVEPTDGAAEVSQGDAAPVADAGTEAAPSAEAGEAAAAADATKTESADAPPVLDEAAPPAELAEAPAAEQPVAALDEAPAAPAPEEAVADHPPEPSLPEEDVMTDTVKAELTDQAPTPPPAAAPAKAAPEAPAAAAPESIADSFENKSPAPDASGAIVDGNSISSPGAARFVKSVHKQGGHSHKLASHHTKHGHKGHTAGKAAAGAAGGNYVVVPGDTLGKISKKIYGDTKQWKSLADLNGLVDPFLIRTGEIVKFDDSSEKAKAYVSGHKTAMKSVIVKDGDSLSKIAAAVYGDSSKWTLLLNQNKDQIADPNNIASGMTLAYVEIEGGTQQAAAAPAAAAPAAVAPATPHKATAKAQRKKAPAAAGAVKESH